MRSFIGGFADSISGETLSLCRLLTIASNPAGRQWFLTDHNADVVEGSNTFSSAGGFTCSSILSASGTQAQGATVTINLRNDSSGISMTDIVHGWLVGATTLLRYVDWKQPDHGSMILCSGIINKVTVVNDRQAQLELSGLMNQNLFVAVETYSSLCRANLGDGRCKFNIDSLKKDFTVASVTNDLLFTTAELNQADAYWTLGVLTWTGGFNGGISTEVRASKQADKSVELWVPSPFGISVGDTGTIWPGCDKSLTMCHDRYNNVINFRGEPFVVPLSSTEA